MTPSSIPVANTAVLDGDGTIVEVNEAWRTFGDANGLRTPHAGVGQNYLKFCVFAGSDSSQIQREYMALLDGRRDLVSFLYDCHSDCEERWFTAVAFPQGPSRFVIAHVNVTQLIRHGRSLESPVRNGGGGSTLGADAADGVDVLTRLTPRQRQILMLLAQGKTNREIAATLSTSPNTVRSQVSAILRRLQLKNRVGAARLLASRQALDAIPSAR